MKLIFIRHGDPDYERDGLTETGVREAQLLNARVRGMKIDKCYVSPLGRAKETAELGLEGTGIVPVEYEWLREFCPPVIKRPDRPERDSVCWDWIPKDFCARENLFDVDHWGDEPEMAAGNVRAEYDRVCASLDALLAENGYVRDGRMYRAIRPNNDTLVFFCHFGLTCVCLSHLINVSPMILWQGTCCAPTSITTVITEERREGEAYFRASSIGDTGHLYAAGAEPSFSARFCECWTNKDERHD